MFTKLLTFKERNAASEKSVGNLLKDLESLMCVKIAKCAICK